MAKTGTPGLVTVERPARNSRNMALQLAMAALALAIYIWSARGTHLSLSELRSGMSGMVDLVSRMLPPDFSILSRLAAPIIETIQISIWGTTLAILLSIPFGFLAARNIAPHHLIYRASRLFLNATRAISATIFALIFVAAVGLGPFPGVLALAIHSTGMLGKFLADAVENIDPGPVDALTATGATKLQVIVFAIIPQIMPEFISLSLFRWEMNFRSSTILGIVGAGGIGFELVTCMRLFRYQELTVILLIIFLVVTALDGFSSAIRKRFL
jgi:phosphonate transport system permease protein